jgi:tetratricopeptide (TPR) repeat protein
MTVISASPATRSLELEIRAAREAVLRRDPNAREQAQSARRRAATLAARAELIAALATADSEHATDAAEIDGAIAAAKRLPDPDVETMLDLALALLIADRAEEAVDILMQGLLAGAADAVTPSQLMAFIDQLLGDRRADEAEDLLRAVYARLIARPRRVPTGGGTPAPRVELSRRRRFLKEALRLVDERLETGGDEPTLLTLRAGTLIGLGELNQALETVLDVVKRYPSNALARDVLVAVLARMRHYDSAVTELEQLPEERLQEPDAVSTQVDLLVRSGASERAVEVARRAVDNMGANLEVRTAYVRALAASGDLSQALPEAHTLVADYPQHADALVVLAEVLRLTGADEEALETLRRATSLDPSNAFAHTALARALEAQGDAPRALDELEQALTLDPANADLLLERARLLFAVGRSVEALELVEQADVATHPRAAALRADIHREHGRFDDALVWYERAFDGSAEDRDDTAAKIVAVCDTLFDEGDYGPALDGLDFLVEHGVDLPPATIALRAELLRLRARLRAAVEACEEARAAGFEEDWLIATHAQALIDLDRARSALPLAQRLINESPDYVYGRTVWVSALIELDRVTEALAMLDEWFPLDDLVSGWEVWTVGIHASQRSALGRHADAIAVLEEALERSDREADWLAVLGFAHARLWQLTAAEAAFQHAFALHGSDMPSWALIELADVLVASAGELTPDAASHYERVIEREIDNAIEVPSPNARVRAGWAHLRLGRPEQAVEQFRIGFDETESDMLDWRMSLSAALMLKGDDDGAQRELDELLRLVRELPDRERAKGVVHESVFNLRMLEMDPSLRDAGSGLARLRERLDAEEAA